MSSKLERCMKILTLAPWLQQVGSATFGELSKRFDYPPKELLRDLVTLTMVGIPPYDPGTLTCLSFIPDEEVYEAYNKKKEPDKDWTVSMTDGNYFEFPPKLTSEEVMILLTAYSMIKSLKLKLDPTLKKVFKKLQSSFESNVGKNNVEVAFRNLEADVKFHTELKEAIESETQIKIHYHSLRDSKKDYYTIDPWRIYFLYNAWYLEAYCHSTKVKRVFRVSRIEEVENLKQPFSEDGISAHKKDIKNSKKPDIYITEEGTPEVVLELEATGRWALDFFIPSEIKELPENKIQATLHIGSALFLEKLLLQIGKSGKVISGDKKLQAKAARNLLKKYA